MANRYLLTIENDIDGDTASEEICEQDAMDILADFGTISYKKGTLVPSFSEFFVLRCKMERGEAAKFFYNDIVDGSPITGTIMIASKGA